MRSNRRRRNFRWSNIIVGRASVVGANIGGAIVVRATVSGVTVGGAFDVGANVADYLSLFAEDLSPERSFVDLSFLLNETVETACPIMFAMSFFQLTHIHQDVQQARPRGGGGGLGG